MSTVTIAVDLAKNVFELAVASRADTTSGVPPAHGQIELECARLDGRAADAQRVRRIQHESCLYRSSAP